MAHDGERRDTGKAERPCQARLKDHRITCRASRRRAVGASPRVRWNRPPARPERGQHRRFRHFRHHLGDLHQAQELLAVSEDRPGVGVADLSSLLEQGKDIAGGEEPFAVIEQDLAIGVDVDDLDRIHDRHQSHGHALRRGAQQARDVDRAAAAANGLALFGLRHLLGIALFARAAVGDADVDLQARRARVAVRVGAHPRRPGRARPICRQAAADRHAHRGAGVVLGRRLAGRDGAVDHEVHALEAADLAGRVRCVQTGLGALLFLEQDGRPLIAALHDPEFAGVHDRGLDHLPKHGALAGVREILDVVDGDDRLAHVLRRCRERKNQDAASTPFTNFHCMLSPLGNRWREFAIRGWPAQLGIAGGSLRYGDERRT